MEITRPDRDSRTVGSTRLWHSPLQQFPFANIEAVMLSQEIN